jgi:hypothetical protein
VNKMMLKFPVNFGEALRQVFVGTPRVASPDLQNLSDKALEDIGLVRLRTDFEAVKPFVSAPAAALSSSASTCCHV